MIPEIWPNVYLTRWNVVACHAFLNLGALSGRFRYRLCFTSQTLSKRLYKLWCTGTSRTTSWIVTMPHNLPGFSCCWYIIAEWTGQATLSSFATPTLTVSTHLNDSETAPSLSTPDVRSLSESLSKIKDQAHANRLTIQQQLIEGKGTEEAYTRHVKSYLSFWSSFQDQKIKEDPQWARIPAHPITGDKVAIFLQHETTRNKVCYYFTALKIFLVYYLL